MRQFISFCFCLLAVTGVQDLLAAEPAASSTALSPLNSYQIRNKQFGDLLRPEGANGATGTRLVLYPAQPWKCMTWKFHASGESAFQLQNHFTSKTFAAESETQNPEQPIKQVPLPKQGTDGPVWQFTKLPDGTYKIAEAKSGKVLTAIKEQNSSTVRILLQPWKETSEQKWELLPIDPKQLTM